MNYFSHGQGILIMDSLDCFCLDTKVSMISDWRSKLKVTKIDVTKESLFDRSDVKSRNEKEDNHDIKELSRKVKKYYSAAALLE